MNYTQIRRSAVKRVASGERPEDVADVYNIRVTTLDAWASGMEVGEHAYKRFCAFVEQHPGVRQQQIADGLEYSLASVKLWRRRWKQERMAKGLPTCGS